MRTQSICLALAIVLMCPFASGQWVQTNGVCGDLVTCFAVTGNNLYAGTVGAGVFLSTNDGNSWGAISDGLDKDPFDTLRYVRVTALVVSGEDIFAGTEGAGTGYGGIFLSTNHGSSWVAVNNGLTEYGVNTLIASGTDLFAGTWGIGAGTMYGGVFRSTNHGARWIVADKGLGENDILCLAASGENLFAGTSWGLFRSTNNGATWTVSDSATRVSSLVVSGTSIFAGIDGNGYSKWPTVAYIVQSTNSGIDWTSVGPGLRASLTYRLLAVSGTGLFANTYWDRGLFLSTNNGASWTAIDTGITTQRITSLAAKGQNLFAGTVQGTVWRRPLSEFLSVDDRIGSVPVSYALEQNYPNPFNPTTKIQFTIVNRQSTIVKVYDLLGREVTTLVNEVKSPGAYTVEFDGSNLASGVYFYTLHAGDFTQSKKLVLLK
jgi:hypothetical protein